MENERLAFSRRYNTGAEFQLPVREGKKADDYLPTLCVFLEIIAPGDGLCVRGCWGRRFEEGYI